MNKRMLNKETGFLHAYVFRKKPDKTMSVYLEPGI